MEFVRLKYANNKLINANLQEHQDVITEYVMKKHMEYLGFVPVLFGPSGKVLAIDLVFKKPTEAKHSCGATGAVAGGTGTSGGAGVSGGAGAGVNAGAAKSESKPEAKAKK